MNKGASWQWVFVVALSAAAGACAGSDEAQRDTAFGRAVQASLEEQWGDSAQAAFSYVKGAQLDDPKHDRALLILAKSVEGLGLRHAASLWFLDVAQSRRHVELVNPAVAGLERIVMHGPHDKVTLVEGYLATADISNLKEELQAFVDYQHGLANLRQSLTSWAERDFKRIPNGSVYKERAQLAQAVWRLAQSEWDEAEQELRALVKPDDHRPEDVTVEARLALARLAMERKEYPKAISHYRHVQDAASERPSLLLEMAWAHYYRGQSTRALGLLVALDAPAYRGLIAPERYLLEAFCLRRLCQFKPARVAAGRLSRQYGKALEDLHKGVPPWESPPMRNAAGRRRSLQDQWKFLERLRWERQRVSDLEGDLGEELTWHLLEVYDASIEEAERRTETRLRRASTELAEELLSAEDGVRLILHELSVQLLRGRTRPEGPAEQEVFSDVDVVSGKVVYRFKNEFWTDELDDLEVVIPDRCLQ